jgi:hypothetical protein
MPVCSDNQFLNSIRQISKIDGTTLNAAIEDASRLAEARRSEVYWPPDAGRRTL